MSYLRYDKTLMTNLEESLSRELLRTNRSGAYACSTIVDCNTRKYHGQLVIPIPQMDDDHHVLLSALDVTVVQHGAEFNLGLHKYQGGNYSPNGHKYIREFDCGNVPTTLYRVGGVVLRKEVVFQHYEDRLLIRYTLVDAHSKTLLRFKPFLAFRSVKMLTHENAVASRNYQKVDNGIKTCLYDGYPDLYLQFSKENEFVFQPDWYRNIEYPIERERGYGFTEDLYVPGYFETEIKKGESIVFSAAVSETDTQTLQQLAIEEIDSRAPRDNFFHCLVNAAHQFRNREGDDRYILAGYPWFKCRARDTFIALPGLTLGLEETDYFRKVMKTAERGLREWMEGQPLTVKIQEIDQPDVLLWATWTIQQFCKECGIGKGLREYGALLKDIMLFITQGRHPSLFLEDNGLLWVDGKDKVVTWMNATHNGKPVIPRTGYIVEFNALWYNALRFMAETAAIQNRTDEQKQWEARALRCKEAFVEMFYNEYGYLYDYVSDEEQDKSVRPNMIFAVALEYSPLTTEQKKSVLDYCTKELLTPKGLRSLSPKSDGFRPTYVGSPSERDLAYHQGTVRPWLGGFYMEACLKLYKRTRLSFVERQMVGYEDEMSRHCLGTISELYDGNPPFDARGAISFAMNVAEVLRTLNLLETYNYQK